MRNVGRLNPHMCERSFHALPYEKKNFYVVWSHINSMVISFLQTKWRFFPMYAFGLKKCLHRSKVLFMIYICGIIIMQMKVCKKSNCCGNMAKNVNFLISTSSYGKGRKKFENPETPSCSAHQSSLRFVNN